MVYVPRVFGCVVATGGGQPSDIGKIHGSGGVVFNVVSVKKDPETGVVRHTGTFAGDAVFAVDDEVELDVDEATRRLHARLHSAGHLIDVAMGRIGVVLKAGKGSHSKDMYAASVPTHPYPQANDAFAFVLNISTPVCGC
jgi:Ser-tRNA(Ala) deacylase AlaX